MRAKEKKHEGLWSQIRDLTRSVTKNSDYDDEIKIG